MLTRAGFEVAEPTPAQLGLAKRQLTVAPFTLASYAPRPFAVYRRTPTGGLVVPQFWARAQGWRGGEDARSPGAEAPALARFASELLPALDQPASAAAILEELTREGGGGALMSLPMGSGKTTVALYVASRLRRKVLVLVHQSPLMTQWADRVAQFLPDAKVSFVRRDAMDLSGDVVVAMLQTLLARKYPPSAFEACGFVIADECHHIGAEKFSQVMFSLSAPRVLGLSATPERADKLGRVVNWFVGPTVVSIKCADRADVRVRFVEYSCPAYKLPPPTKPTRLADGSWEPTTDHAKVVTALTEDEARTARVVAEVRGLLAEGRDVLVVSDRREHCVRIAELVGAEASTFLGGDKLVPETRAIVATYGLVAEGVDVPRLNALVMATPRSTVEQTCGRVMRGKPKEGALGPVIVDFRDRWGPCVGKAAKRLGFYEKAGFSLPPEYDRKRKRGAGRGNRQDREDRQDECVL